MTTDIYWNVWRRQFGNAHITPWFRTAHTLKARTEKEAQGKLRRMFAGCGFHSMSLVAVPAGSNPNPPRSLT